MFAQKLLSSSIHYLNTRLASTFVQNVVPAVSSCSILLHQHAANYKFPSVNNSLIYRKYCTNNALEPMKSISNNTVIENVNHLTTNCEEGRLFAIVHICGKQFRIVEGDIIVIEGYWPPDIGDKISLDKILLVGSADFSLIGRPLIKKGLVNVTATVIEKTLSHTKTHFKKKRRKQYMRINFYRSQHTMLRINNTIEVQDQVNSSKETKK
ncbi:39S ribosomal protein L21, mitochondrial-like [Ctenocephalides felis]|uniref:39S ribosomal protein L21, mitochondrial-like n=1 Tax=Ctenocephalides felis TaxID=7515 RepID=UPI000E6E3091|nr:39S ribosomal protein L21, mitochondrial-like [Ctenocephalides felis]